MNKIEKKIWAKAKKVIPGGNGLLSKRPERFSNSWMANFIFLRHEGIRYLGLE